ncbi:uncharacterized protein LACBIDRAFT_309898 [Laccaria bicolor S238N-H82]|uniref:Predicted protein n=1 Tax=Laccaria bicolor (strain S238N-H82 / ATCC MYA-4686) TaxID=486041 RepID=B0DTB3_LACBS|nr:uncharacterized protein LACBIDRAFT_309898 [Laccaria bicolor S238N-H82]EDR02190.1 predicted protein [Laccaria bicolor S238N-H82]|eukprot:XP_001887135.1 predicted protein [Laccaria bicolor S238N-H82]
MANLPGVPPQEMCLLDNNDDDLTDVVERDGEFNIGIGEHSDLWKGRLSVEGVPTLVAIKVLRGGSSSRPDFREHLIKSLRRQGILWLKLSHPHVSKFYGFVYNFGILPGLVLEFYEGKNVMEYTKRENSDETKLRLVGEIALGLKYLHQQWPPIVHGDLRGANVLIDSAGHAVVADYGLASIMDSAEFTSIKTAGTCRWTAPEIMDPPASGDIPLPQFTVKSDVFSYAMTVFEIFAGERPFNEKKSDSSVIFAILNGNRPTLPEFFESKSDLAKLVQQCWSQNPDQRPTARQICRSLGLTTWYWDWLDTVRGYLPV